ncbi:MAG: hypothetical protein Q8P90_04000 [bacterium]|nr:hypothetical protein [bacterium]
MIENKTKSVSTEKSAPKKTVTVKETVVQGTVVEKVTVKELSGGAQAGINIGIGATNVCCGPACYCVPSLFSTITGIILYFVWKDEKPKTAKTILLVTIITASVAILILAMFFFLGFAGGMIDAMSNY